MGTVHAFPATAILLAQSRQIFHWDLWLTAAGLFALLALGAWAIYKVKEWHDDSAASTGGINKNDQATDYDKMAAEGLIEPDELARIKVQLDKPPSGPEAPKDSAKESPPNPPPGADKPPDALPPAAESR